MALTRSLLERILFLTLPVLLPASQAAASMSGDASPEISGKSVQWASSFQWENDCFFDEDRYYTNGLRFSWVSPDLNPEADAGAVMSAAAKIADLVSLSGRDETARHNVELVLGQKIFTPWNVFLADPNPRDRPYCGWLYMSASFHNRTARMIDTLTLDLGVTGSWSGAKPVQQFFHDNVSQGDGSSDFDAWDYQLGDEVEIDLSGERQLRLWRAGDGSGFAADASAHLGGSLGTLYTYLNAGFSARCGWNIPEDFGADPIRVTGNILFPDAEGGSSWFRGLNFFADVDGRAVGRDGTLDGNLFRDSASVDKRPYVFDVTIGLNLRLWSWKLSASGTRRSREFHTQRPNQHYFGSLSLSRAF